MKSTINKLGIREKIYSIKKSLPGNLAKNGIKNEIYKT